MGWTPLMIAASVKDGDKLVEFLLSKGADPNVKSKQTSKQASRLPRWGKYPLGENLPPPQKI